MLGTLQEQIVSVQAHYSIHSSIHTYVAVNGTTEAIFSLFLLHLSDHHQCRYLEYGILLKAKF